MRGVVLALLVLALAGCATVSDYCDEHPTPCNVAAVAGTVVVIGVIGVTLAHASRGGAPVRLNAPAAPISLPPPPPCTQCDL